MKQFALDILDVVKDLKNYIEKEKKYKIIPIKQNPVFEQKINTQANEQEQSNKTELNNLKRKLEDCYLCGLARHRIKPAFDSGNPDADIMLIGDAPSKKDMRYGKVFSSDAGILLDKMLKAVELSREEVYITNILKCHIPNDRIPRREESEICMPVLKNQIEIINPKIILALGSSTGNLLLNLDNGFDELRKKNFEEEHFFLKINQKNIPVFITYHPAELIENNALKRPNWEDMKAFMNEYKKLGLYVR